MADMPSSADGRRTREPAFNIAPVVVALIAACVGVHLIRVHVLSEAADIELLVRAAFIPARYSGDYTLDLYAFLSPVTYSLLHGDYLHLSINMVWLAAFGSPFANRIGAWRFLLFWMFTAAAAVALHFAVHPQEAVPVIGASGAVSGMMAAAARYGFAVDRSGRRPAFSGPRLALGAMMRRRNVVVFLAVWMIVNLVAGLGWLVPGEGPSIAWEAHIGGFLAGLLGIALFDRTRSDPAM
jgi:membrane associated rhomboid family serine protease